MAVDELWFALSAFIFYLMKNVIVAPYQLESGKSAPFQIEIAGKAAAESSY